MGERDNDVGKPGARARDRPQPILILAGLTAAVMVWMVARSPAHYLYDELYYIQGAWLLVLGSTFREMLLAPLDTPAGPLYPVLHWLLAPLTGLQAPAIRWPNLVLVGIGTAANAYTVHAWRFDACWARAAMVLAVPMVWVTAGMALTEIPSFACASFTVALVAWAMTAPAGATTRIWAGFLIAAMFFGLAILGRQPYLLATGAFGVIALFERRLRWPALAGAVLTIAVPLPIFLLWGGLVTPHVAFVGGIDIAHGALAYAYMGVTVLILAPAWYLPRWRWTLGAGVIGGVIGLTLGGLNFTVAAGVAHRLPPVLASLFQWGVSVALIGGGVAFIVASAVNVWLRRGERLFVLATLLTLGLTATPAAVVHLFSSRYLMTAFPFVLFAVQPFFRPSRWAALRFAGGAAVGYVSLAAYLNGAPPTP